MTPAKLAIRCADGVELSGRLFSPPGTPHGNVVLAPALGVPQGFYRAMAEFLCDRGFTAVTFDYRGVGASRHDRMDMRSFTLEQWGVFDMDAVLGLAREFNDRPVFLLGHSAGGQLFGLARNAACIAALVMVSSLIPWWKHFPWPWSARVWVLMHLLMPLFSAGRDVFPARKLGISSVDVPSGVTRQWCRWGRRPDYFFDRRWGLDLSRYAELRFPVLVCHVDDDHYAPWAAIQALLAKMPATQQEIWHVDSALAPGGKIGHVDFFREPMRAVYWERIAGWLASQAGNGCAPGYD
jgi:predicted alpha/beta hydrolase